MYRFPHRVAECWMNIGGGRGEFGTASPSLTYRTSAREVGGDIGHIGSFGVVARHLSNRGRCDALYPSRSSYRFVAVVLFLLRGLMHIARGAFASQDPSHFFCTNLFYYHVIYPTSLFWYLWIKPICCTGFYIKLLAPYTLHFSIHGLWFFIFSESISIFAHIHGS